MKVLITPRGFATYGLAEIQIMKEKGLEVHYNDSGSAYTHEAFRELAHDADAIIVGVDRMDRELIESCPKLKVICKFGVGTDNIDVDYATQRGIYVGRTVGSNSLAVAEHVLAMMFMESKNLYKTVLEVKQHQWIKDTGRELNGKTLGIVGFGAIGKHLARMAQGIGMHVIAYDALAISDEDAASYALERKTMDEILHESDYVSLHIPLLESTLNLINKEALAKMKPSACLVNAARGGIVDEDALYEALSAGTIRSACFDVFSSEPPQTDSPLVQLDNFFLTSHTAARTQESEKRTCQQSARVILEQLGV